MTGGTKAATRSPFTEFKMIAIIFVFCLSVWSGVYADSPCLGVKAIDDLNMTAFASGTWYEIARYPTEWESHADCLVAKFSREGDVYKFSITDVNDSTHKSGSFGGDVEMDAKKSGVINYISPIYKAYTGTDRMTATIVNVDYNHYCIFYECEFDPVKKVRHDHVWILSRSKTLETEARKRLDEFFKANNYLDLNKLIWIHFTENACKV